MSKQITLPMFTDAAKCSRCTFGNRGDDDYTGAPKQPYLSCLVEGLNRVVEYSIRGTFIKSPGLESVPRVLRHNYGVAGKDRGNIVPLDQKAPKAINVVESRDCSFKLKPEKTDRNCEACTITSTHCVL